MKTIPNIRAAIYLATILLTNPLPLQINAQESRVTEDHVPGCKGYSFDLNCADKLWVTSCGTCLERWSEATSVEINRSNSSHRGDGETLALRRDKAPLEEIDYERYANELLQRQLQEARQYQPWHERHDFYFDLESLVRGIRTQPLF